jgi:hypothetical protein
VRKYIDMKTTLGQLKKIEKMMEKKRLSEWALAIKERDGYRCAICNTCHRLNSHHILPKRIYKEVMYEITNGISLCCGDHMFLRGSPHMDGMAFAIWLEKNRPEQYAWVRAYLEGHAVVRGFKAE